jgi:hypothetical protein
VTYDQLIAHYGTMAEAGAAIQLSRQAVYAWRARGVVPLDKQLDYEVATNGALRADIPEETRKVLARKKAAA